MNDPDAPAFSDEAIARDDVEIPVEEGERGGREPSLRAWARRPSAQRVLMRNLR